MTSEIIKDQKTTNSLIRKEKKHNIFVFLKFKKQKYYVFYVIFSIGLSLLILLLVLL
ncbi:MAG: hypothetical protein GQ557_01975 [Mycoplasmataceae bacterium]|nr:hypothetical protein [Mycoplasmataceae bacterium]